MKAEEILYKHEEKAGGAINGWQAKWIIDAMEEYAQSKLSQDGWVRVEELSEGFVAQKYAIEYWKVFKDAKDLEHTTSFAAGFNHCLKMIKSPVPPKGE